MHYELTTACSRNSTDDGLDVLLMHPRARCQLTSKLRRTLCPRLRRTWLADTTVLVIRSAMHTRTSTNHGPRQSMTIEMTKYFVTSSIRLTYKLSVGTENSCQNWAPNLPGLFANSYHKRDVFRRIKSRLEKGGGTTPSPSIVENMLFLDRRCDVKSTFRDLGPCASFLHNLKIIGLSDRYAPHHIRW